MDTTDINKKYSYEFRNIYLDVPFIIIEEDIPKKLKYFVSLLEKVKFEYGIYHTYYGEIKNIVSSFIAYWTNIMDIVLKKTEKLMFLNKAELFSMLEITVSSHQEMQEEFEKEFLPVQNSFEKEILHNIQVKYTTVQEFFSNLKEKLESLDKKDKVEVFAKEHFQMSLKRTHDLFTFTHNFVSLELVLVVERIRVSLEEIVARFRNNVQSMREMSEENKTRLIHRLYEKNKEHLILTREDARPSVELTEIQRSMEILRDKIAETRQVPGHRLEDEYNYSLEKFKEFQKINKLIKKVRAEQSSLMEQKKMYLELKDIQIPPAKKKCWEHMEDEFNQKLDELREHELNAARALLSFFSIRGSDRIYYLDNFGEYFVDDYGHQCYIFDHGLNVYHVTCTGDLVDKLEKEKYYFDDNGRFILNKKNEKVYQIAACSSTYNRKNKTFIKTTHDCGHSEALKEKCRMEIKDSCDAILPDIEPVDIKAKLTGDDGEYLWETFGPILPDILSELAKEQPKNPIHILAHKILSFKYNRRDKEINKETQEAFEFREKMHQDRINAKIATHKAWKAKQVKRRKPEESDDAEEKFVQRSYFNAQEFIQNLENFYS